MTASGPGLPRVPEPVIARFVEACSADERIVAVFLAGSVARDEADEYSDVDLCVVTTDGAYDDVVAGRADLIQRLGDPLFLEDFGLQATVFAILDDGSEWEIVFFREGDLDEIHVGPYRSLLDKKGILTEAEFPLPEPDRADLGEQLRRILQGFWHDLSHFIAAFGRGQLWWAFGQLEALRASCVNLARIEQGVEAQDEAYEKLDVTIPTARLAALRSTFCPMEERAMLQAVRDIVAFYRERGPAVARAYGLTYPLELDRIMSPRLDQLVADPQ